MNTQDYRLAPGGEGPHADTWNDKPHRLIYDLCGEIERLEGVFVEKGYPKLLIHRGKHGNRYILAANEVQEHDAWLMMFRALDEWDDCYYDLEGDEVDAYARARGGCGRSAKFLLQIREGYEYESVELEYLDTPESIKEHLDA